MTMDARNLPEMPELMIAGPGEIGDDELAIMGRQMIAHYGDTWVELHRTLIDDLGTLFNAADAPYVIPGTGTTALDATMLNLFEPGQRVAVVQSGFFGTRLNEVASQQGLEVVEIPVEIGAPVDLNAVEAAAKGADGVLTVHVETSTGVRHPVVEIAQIANAAGSLCVVDAIASAGGEDLDVDGSDFAALVTGSQKGLEAPPGVGIVVLGARGRARMAARSAPVSSWYLDLARWDWYRKEWPWHPHPVTMPVSLMLALSSSVRRILDAGAQEWVAKRAALARRLRDALTTAGFEPVPQADVQANMIVCMWEDHATEVVGHVVQQGIQISGGLAPLAGKTIRVGLMGRTATEAMVDRVTDALILARKETRS
jgi:alanine-glyoxylate transaminase / serine-glyoxylate transaminase / serine-pyruvate transaminase